MSLTGSMMTMTMAAIAAAGPAASVQPVTLDIADGGGTLRIRVVGRSAGAIDARYSLTLEAPGSGNSTRQDGAARLEAGRETVLADLTMSTGATGWRAILEVTPSTGAPYRIERASAG